MTHLDPGDHVRLDEPWGAGGVVEGWLDGVWSDLVTVRWDHNQQTESVRYTRLVYVGPAILARLTADGTAAAETAVCWGHRESSAPVVDLVAPAESTVTGLVNCSGNDQLSCIVCGAMAA
jgi:hypothetical protein